MASWLTKTFGNKTGNLIGGVLTGYGMPGPKLLPKTVLDPTGTLLDTDNKPVLETVDPAKEQADAENKAAAAANSKAATRKRASRNSSLLATGGAGVTSPAQTQSVLAYGKQKLGD
jgi:hypothetical protein